MSDLSFIVVDMAEIMTSQPTASDSTIPRLTTCDYGPSSSRALLEAIERSRQDRPFRTVTIIVPTLALGFAATKDMAWEGLISENDSKDGNFAEASNLKVGETAGGVFGLRLFTSKGLGEHILSICDPTSHIPNYSNRELMATLMKLDVQDFGAFAQIRSHPSTYEVLTQTLRELERLSPSSIARLQKSGSSRISDLLHIYDAVQNHFQNLSGGNVNSANTNNNLTQTSQRHSSASMLQKALEQVEGISRQGPLWEYLGSLIVYLPQQLSSIEGGLLRACQPDEIIVGLTGVEAADEMTLSSVAKIAPSLLESTSLKSGLATAQSASCYQPRAAQTVILSAPTPTDEVRIAIRGVVDAIKQGFPADQLAIAYTSATPYRRLLYEYIQSAQISFTHFSGMPLRERIAPKALLAMLDLLDSDFKRLDLINLLASAPIMNSLASAPSDKGSPTRLVPTAAWDRVSSEARVHRGLDQWTERLDRYISMCEAEISLLEKAGEEDSETRIQRIKRNIVQARTLSAFVTSLSSSIEAVETAKTWKTKVKAATQLLDKFLPSKSKSSIFKQISLHQHNWGNNEADAYRQLKKILESLASLDDVHPSPSYADFRHLLDKELEAANRRQGQQNVGVLLTDTNRLLAGSYSHIWILGMVEGCLPMNVREDSLLPEKIRSETPDLITQTSRIHEQHKNFLAALQLASQQVFLSYSRLNPLGGNASLPSRWLLEIVEAMTGEQVFAQDLDELIQRHSHSGSQNSSCSTKVNPLFKFVQSFTADLKTLNFPAQEQEFDLKSLLLECGSPANLADHSLNKRKPSFSRGLDAYFARKSSEFTRFDGNLSTAFAGLADELAKQTGSNPSQVSSGPSDATTTFKSISSPNTPPLSSATTSDPAGIFSHPISPTRLEKWAECPQRFFMESILKLSRIEPLDDFENLTPLVKGNIVHKTLECFFNEILGANNSGVSSPLNTSKVCHSSKLPSHPHSWTPEQKQRLLEIAEQCCREAISSFIFGPEVYHKQEIENIQTELELFLDEEAEFRKSNNCYPIGLEVSFGKNASVAYPLEGGRSILFHGRIDRVDVDTESRKIIVIDYKTGKHNSGKPYSFTDIKKENPDVRGRKLQMPLYLKAAKMLYRNLSCCSKSSKAQNTSPNLAFYWFVNSDSEFYKKKLEFTDNVINHTDRTLNTLHKEITRGVFPPGLHDNSNNASSCPWCDSDNFGVSKYSQFMESKLLEEQLAPWLELAYPDKLPQENQ